MKHSFFLLRSCLGALGVITFVIVAAKSEATSIQLSPMLPIPGDSVNVSITFDSCIQFDRWEKSANRIIVYSRRLNFSPCPGGGITDIALGVLNAGFYLIEVLERSVDAPLPPDGYTKTAEQRFSVALGRAIMGKPTKIVVSGSMTTIQDYRNATEVTFAVKDATNASVPDAPLGLRTAKAGALSLEYACDLFAISNDCPAYQTAGNGAIAITVPPPSDAEGALVTTVIGTTIIDNRTLSAYASIGYIDALRSDIVVPVVEYEIDASITALPTRYFLSANDATSLGLDNAPNAFRRTYAAFFGVKPSTPGAVPVCRFFTNGKAGLSLSHLFTADASDCAVKKADSRYADEGVPFWAYPASASGACPNGTRGVSRYVLTYGSDASNRSFRYSTLLSMKSQAARGGADTSGVTVKNDGVAFCVLD